MAALREPNPQIGFHCIREENFEAMFQALGNRQKQETIRSATPDGVHCAFLRESPFACSELPRSFGDISAGSICPNNPYSQEAGTVFKIEMNRRLLAVAIDAHRHMQVQGLSEDAPRIEVILAYAYHRFLEERQWQKPLNS